MKHSLESSLSINLLHSKVEICNKILPLENCSHWFILITVRRVLIFKNKNETDYLYFFTGVLLWMKTKTSKVFVRQNHQFICAIISICWERNAGVTMVSFTGHYITWPIFCSIPWLVQELSYVIPSKQVHQCTCINYSFCKVISIRFKVSGVRLLGIAFGYCQIWERHL